MYDMKIANGLIVDGTGAPGRVGDVGIRKGHIVDVFDAPEDAAETIDATGLVVGPGVIDVHTHLDAQLLWDPSLGISPDHGVTTVIMGNCGFGIAPTHSNDRELIMRTLENVEGIDFDCMKAGLGTDWGFETFPQYLKRIEAAPKQINTAMLVPHTPVRRWVMGDAASERSANEEEVAQMRQIVEEGLDAGAIGLSTSGSPTHIGAGGKPVPSRFATMEEVLALASTLKGRDPAIFMCTLGPNLSFPELRQVAEATGRPVTFAAILADLGGVGRHRSLMERVEAIRAEGLDLVPQVACRPVLMEFTFREPYAFTTSAPAMMRVTLLDDLFAPVYEATNVEAKLAAYQKPGFAEELVKVTDSPTWHERLWAFTTVVESPRHPNYEQVPLPELARSLGQHPAQVMLDLSVESRLTDRFVMGFVNNDEEAVKSLLLHPGTQIGLSDAGAHANMICDACYPTYLLGRWVREKGAIPLETAVAMLTGDAARLFGLADRGLLSVGKAADIFVFDADTVDAGTPHLVRDLPGGAARLVATSTGVEALIVNGEIVRRSGSVAIEGSDLPGQLLRHGTGPA
jgi:N-acyl-D-amino-acid deacylase